MVSENQVVEEVQQSCLPVLEFKNAPDAIFKVKDCYKGDSQLIQTKTKLEPKQSMYYNLVVWCR